MVSLDTMVICCMQIYNHIAEKVAIVNKKVKITLVIDYLWDFTGKLKCETLTKLSGCGIEYNNLLRKHLMYRFAITLKFITGKR